MEESGASLPSSALEGRRGASQAHFAVRLEVAQAVLAARDTCMNGTLPGTPVASAGGYTWRQCRCLCTSLSEEKIGGLEQVVTAGVSLVLPE